MQSPTSNSAGPLHGLGARLFTAAGLVQKGRTVCDVGCDHGKLSVALAVSGIAPKVIAIDASEQPLQRAQELVQKRGCGKIVSCRLGSGLSTLAPHEAGEIVIAGLSGETMVEILGTCEWIKSEGVHLVLVPTGGHTCLRRWLYKNGFELHKECPVVENKRPYTVMSAFYIGGTHNQSQVFYLLGLVPQAKNEAAAAYIQKKLRHLCNKSKAAKTPEEKTAHAALVNEVKKCLQ